jgi:hypothetical protein
MINLPLLIFLILTFDILEKSGSPNNIILYIQIILIFIVNIYLTLTASTDPGIIPARNWSGCK